MKTLEQRVIHVIADQLGLNESEITVDSTTKALDMDSLDNVEVIMGLEDEFEIEIPDERCEEWLRVKDVVDCLKEISK
jgi:acyl carrier protein